MKRILAITACVVLVATALFWWTGYVSSARQAPPAAGSDPAPDTPGFPATGTSPAAQHHPSAPQSGPYRVQIEGASLQVDAQGNLVPAPQVRQLFDTLARQQGQIPADLWKDSILDAYRDQLGNTATQQLETLLKRYVEYNLALQMLPMDGVASLAGALDHVQQIRDEYLGEASTALFRDWQQMESFTEQYVMQVVNSRGVVQLRQTLQEQVYALPASVQPRAQKVLDQSQDLFAALPSAQTDSATLQSIAEQTAALALMQPDFTFGEPSAEFMEQYHQYNSAKQRLQQQDTITSEDDPRLQQLRQEYFSGSDVLRVKTLDRAQMY